MSQANHVIGGNKIYSLANVCEIMKNLTKIFEVFITRNQRSIMFSCLISSYFYYIKMQLASSSFSIEKKNIIFSKNINIALMAVDFTRVSEEKIFFLGGN